MVWRARYSTGSVSDLGSDQEAYRSELGSLTLPVSYRVLKMSGIGSAASGQRLKIVDGDVVV
jgi:hypothetical protein